MVHNYFQAGGAPNKIDYYNIIDSNVYKAIKAFYKHFGGAYIIQGVTTNGSNISEGLVYIGDELCSFPGATGVSYPIFLVKSETFAENKLYQDGQSKPTQRIFTTTIETSQPGAGEFIRINSTGGVRIEDAMGAAFVRLVGNQSISGTKNFQNITANNVYSKTDVDTLINGGLGNEASIRANADTVLQNNINAEASTRSNTDTYLLSQINNEASTRSSADSTLQQNINIEISNRTNVDSSLQTQINNKANIAQGGWNTLSLFGGSTGTLCYRKNSIGQLEIWASITVPSGVSTIGTLPAGFRPTDRSLRLPYLSSESGGSFTKMFRIETNGNIVRTDTTASNIGFDGTFGIG